MKLLTPDDASALSALTPVAGPSFIKLVEGVGTAIRQKAGKAAKAVVDQTIVDLSIGFNEYLETSYRKTKYVKTLLNPFSPMEVLSLYVNCDLKSGQTIINDIDLISSIHNYRRVVITGLAGSGKSMFMRYLTLSKFENPNGSLPLFVELRQLNPLSKKDLISFVHYACTSGKNSVTRDQFDLALRSGGFFLILDGFDELDFAHADEIERQILELEHLYPDLTVVISGRPDPRFASWQNHFVFEVKKFTQSQAIKLVNNIEYDDGVKKRFIKEIKSKLWSSHQSFLHYPLLVTIMLLTYEQFADIPDKLHVFYGQAFDTLFQRHDAQKAQFVRENRTGLSIDDFKSCFSAFCIFSYAAGSHSFTEEQISKFANDAIKYCQTSIAVNRFKISADDFIADLQQAVCLIQRDGVLLTFVHRSFQEYFAALFVSTLHHSKLGKILDRLKESYNDSTLPMALEMNRETIEVEWVIPGVSRMLQKLDAAGDNFGLKYAIFFERIYIHSVSDTSPGALGPSTGSEYSLLQSLTKMYPATLGKLQASGFFFMPDIQKMISYFKSSNVEKYNSVVRKEEISKSNNASYLEVYHDIDSDDHHWLKDCDAEDYFTKLHAALSKLVKEAQSRSKKSSNLIDELF